MPQYPPVSDMHVGVVDSDLGTPGSTVPGCDNSMVGDDGEMNPILQGQALMMHEPWVGGTIPPSLSFGRPTDCSSASEYPTFISFESGSSTTGCTAPACETSSMAFTHDFQCNAGLYVNGCGLESQIEAVYRALVWYDPSDHQGNTSPNAGFMRDDALLAIVWVTDEEDGSVRNTQYANSPPEPALTSDATDVYNAASTAWGSANLNLRFYLYTPGGAQDPTWDLGRYIDPTNLARGFMSLKPGHPERVIAAAITGIPITGWDPTTGSMMQANWDALLGRSGRLVVPDDFINRDTMMAIDTMAAEGHVSMKQNNPDPNCPERTVPSCYRQGTTPNTSACTTDVQYFAWPSRREIELIRRLDVDPLCNGAAMPQRPRHLDLRHRAISTAMQGIVAKIQSRLTGKCLPRALQQTVVDGNASYGVQCVVRELRADGHHGVRYDAQAERIRSTRSTMMPSGQTPVGMVTHVTMGGVSQLECDVAQVYVQGPGGANPGQPITIRPCTVGTTARAVASEGGMSCSASDHVHHGRRSAQRHNRESRVHSDRNHSRRRRACHGWVRATSAR